MTNQPHETDVAFIQALAELLNKNDLTELTVKREYGENDSLNVKVSKQTNMVTTISAQPQAMQAAPQAAAAPAPAADADPARHPGAVTSPMVGTGYLCAEPGGGTVRIDRQYGHRRPDPADHRGDEDDEPDPRAPRRCGPAHRGRGWLCRRIRCPPDDRGVTPRCSRKS